MVKKLLLREPKLRRHLANKKLGRQFMRFVRSHTCTVWFCVSNNEIIGILILLLALRFLCIGEIKRNVGVVVTFDFYVTILY